MSNDAIIKVVSVIGNSDSGKTTLLEKVIAELKHRGYRVGVIKHTYRDCEIDQPGKDTWRYTQAGSNIVALSSPAQLAIIEHLDRESGLADIVGLLEGKVDIILTEGYKDSATAKVLVRGNEGQAVPSFTGESLAIVSPSVAPNGVMHFAHEDVARIVDLMIEYLATGHASGERIQLSTRLY